MTDLKKDKITKFLKVVVGNFWFYVMIPFNVFILFFLGALKKTYGYESTMQQNLTVALGEAGNTLFNSTYMAGYESPLKWFIITTLCLVTGLYLYVDDIKETYYKKKQINKGDEE